MKYYTVFAQAYGQGDYGTCTYNVNNSQCSTGAGATGSGGSGLANTGVGLIALLTLACLIIFAALIIRIWRRKPAAQEVENIEEVDAAEEKRLSDRY